jgi:acyl-CoA synthetase (AMP-forming)/AMP-acid ligase II/thioesterase domain-containing protein
MSPLQFVNDDTPASRLLRMPQTIADVIERHAAEHPNRPAIVGSDCRPLSFHDLDLWIKQIGRQLRAAGIGPRSRVGLMLPRGPEGAILSVAVASHAISVLLNPNLAEREIEDELAGAGLETLVLPGWETSPASDAAQRSAFGLFEASRATGSLSSVALHEIRQAPNPVTQSGKVSPHSVALIFRTSGTTGTAKTIPVTHDNLLVTASKMEWWFNLSPGDRTALLLPGHYGAAMKLSLLAPLLLGGSVAFPASRHPEDLADWVSELCPTWLWGNPTFFQGVLDRLRSRAGPKLEHSLRFVVSGTAHLPSALRLELEATLGIPVLQSYGMSEAGILAADPAPPAKRKMGTVGPILRHELAIMGPAGDLLPDGKVGEIVVRGRTVSPDIANAAKNKGPGSGDRWLFTGDVGSIDAEGYLTVAGRTKEFINRGGEKISPHEVETALLLHTSIREAAAFPIPHPRLGENVAAAVVLKSGTNTTASEIKDFLCDHLALFKIPQHVFVLAELPRGATGKVSRSQLSQAAAQRIRKIAPPETPLHFQILEIWQKLMGRPDIGIDDDFFEAGGDSLLASQMVLQVEAITRQPIPPSALRAVYTVRQLAAAVLRASPTTQELVTCAKAGNGTPFFFCHGDFLTRGFYALKLADKLNGDQPVFLLHPYIEPDPKLTIEEMAKSYVPHLLAAQPTGAFRLGGYCNGGLVAWEIAHQLNDLGREVEFVVLVDAISLNARFSLRVISRLVRLIAVVAPKRIAEKFKLDGMRAARNRIKSRYQFDPRLRAMSNYIPPKIKNDVVSVVCEESRSKIEFSSRPWNHLARKVHCRYVAGTHHGSVTTHVDELARLLDRLLATGPSGTGGSIESALNGERGKTQ